MEAADRTTVHLKGSSEPMINGVTMGTKLCIVVGVGDTK